MRQRILDLSYKYQLSHIGSCLSMVDILDAIFTVKKPEDKLILSNGHAGLALYVALEKYCKVNAEFLLNKNGVHPNRDDEYIDCSTGSLGQGISIAVGMALTGRKVFCTLSDGEMAEGSVWEALRIASENNLLNLKLVLNCNGWGAYGQTDYENLVTRVRAFGWSVYEGNTKNKIIYGLELPAQVMVMVRTKGEFGQTKGQDCHYKVLTKGEYEALR